MIADLNIEVRVSEFTGLSHGFDRNVLFVSVGGTDCEVATTQRDISSRVLSVCQCCHVFEPKSVCCNWAVDAVHREQQHVLVRLLLICRSTIQVVYILPARCSPEIGNSLPTTHLYIDLSYSGFETSRLCLEVDSAWRESREVSVYRDGVEGAIGTSSRG